MKRKQTLYRRVIFGLVGMAAIFGMMSRSNVWRANAAIDNPDTDATLAAFMRKKLDASSLILEGLALEDSELLSRGAASLLKLSTAEKWQILTDAEYRDHSSSFRKVVKQLSDAAEKKNFDNAALQWFDAMKGCIECHQHVRRERVAKK